VVIACLCSFLILLMMMLTMMLIDDLMNPRKFKNLLKRTYTKFQNPKSRKTLNPNARSKKKSKP
jgi:hypothetical protein